MTKILKIIIIPVVILTLFSASHYTTAQGYTLLEPSVVGESGEEPLDLSVYLEAVFNTFLVVTIFLAVLMFVVGGFQYILSYVPGQKESGRSKLFNAVIGLVIALVSWLILQTINPQLLNFQTQNIIFDISEETP